MARRSVPRTAFTLAVIAAAFIAPPLQAQPAAPGKQPEDKLARVQKLLQETQVETGPFQEKMPLARFLEVLGKQLPKGAGLTLGIDEKAFGDDAAKLAAFPVQLRPMPKEMTLLGALDSALTQARKGLKIEADVGIAPGRATVTTPKLAAYTVVHDVRDLVPLMEPPYQYLQILSKDDGPDARPAPGTAMLRYVFSTMEPRAGETLQLRNRARLIVHASPARQQEVAEMLALLRRIADVAVILDARLYEVDRDTYAKVVGPLLARGKGAVERPVVPLSPGDAVQKALEKLKPLQEGEEFKVPVGGQGSVVSVQEAFRYRSVRPGHDPDAPKAKPVEEKKEAKAPVGGKGNTVEVDEVFTIGHPEDPPVLRTGSTGVAILARVNVSADRRYVRLEFTQKVDQLVEQRKIKYGDKEFGWEPVEEPSVRQSTVRTTITVPDGQPVLLPVAYQPPGGRKWVLVVNPRIYIEEEERAIREAQKKKP